MTVTQLRPRQGLTPEQISHRILAAVRAVFAFNEHLEATDRRMRAAETEELSDATKAYREIIRDAEDRGDSLTPDESHLILPTICDGLRTHDAILERNKDARKNRRSERERVAEALRELQSPAKDDAQASLPGLEDETGLGWFSKDTKAVVYTALLDADERETIDSVQADLLGELAGMSIDAIDFVIDAADAVEDDDAEPEVDEEAVEELDEIVGDDLPV